MFFLNGLLLKAALPIKEQVRSKGESVLCDYDGNHFLQVRGSYLQ